MSDYREVFNTLICAAVEAGYASDIQDKQKRALNLAHVLNRESLAEHLWEAKEELAMGESLHWSAFLTKKIEQDTLLVSVLYPRSRRRVYKSFFVPMGANAALASFVLPKRKGKAAFAASYVTAIASTNPR